MSLVLNWQECSRVLLGHHLPDALVIMTIGATEQHGNHLATGTDTITIESIVTEAADLAAPTLGRDIILTPTMPFGASDHHLPFGATLSLTVETTIQVLVDLARSVHAVGGHRILIVNGHGGNRAAIASAAQIASTRYELAVSYLDYWAVLLSDNPNLASEVNLPGHAGAFETALMMHLRRGLVTPCEPRNPIPPIAPTGPVSVQSQSLWRDIDGYSDDPAAATVASGKVWFEACVRTLAARIVEQSTT